MKQYKIGYTQGTYDLFHIGHLNLLNNAKAKCDYLIVGINSDDLVEEYKNKKTTINQFDRAAIVASIKCVDRVVITNTLDKKAIYDDLHFDAIFIGSDWKGDQRWNETEKQMADLGVSVVYLPHTDGISTTLINQKIQKKYEIMLDQRQASNTPESINEKK